MKSKIFAGLVFAVLQVVAATDYEALVRDNQSTEGGKAPIASEWQGANLDKLAAATDESVIASFVDSEEAALELLKNVKGAYKTDPLLAVQIVEVTHYVMTDANSSWYEFWRAHRDGERRLWTKALLKTAKESSDDYIKTFCLDQLRWCGYPCQAKCVTTIGGGKAVQDFAAMVARELKGETINAKGCGNCDKVQRIGIVGLDTSHSVKFAKLVNVDHVAGTEGFRVTAAYKWGSKDIYSSTNRMPQYVKQIQTESGVEIKESLADLLKEVDFVLLETNDGRPHLEQAMEIFKAGKPVFIDKPVTGSLADAVKLLEAARKCGAKWFCSSCLRFAKNVAEARSGKLGKIRGAEVRSPYNVNDVHPRFYWYAIHGTENLFAIMGPGCEEVRCVAGKDQDLLIGTWKDGRIGVQRALEVAVPGACYGGAVITEKGATEIGGNPGYAPLVSAIMTFFKTGEKPVEAGETLEIYAFMSAAELSRCEGGRAVKLAEVLEKAAK